MKHVHHQHHPSPSSTKTNALTFSPTTDKFVIKNSKLSTAMDVLNEITPMKQAFLTTVALIKGAVTFPVSSIVCERSFSKMKLIKNYARNSMGDERLSDLSVLAIENEIQHRF